MPSSAFTSTPLAPADIVARVVDAAPPLTQSVRARLAALLNGAAR